MRAQCRSRKTLKSLTSVILFLFSAITISGCGTGSRTSEPDPATLIVDGTPTEVPYIMTIEGQKISLDEYRFFYLTLKEKMDQGDDTYWTQPEKDEREQKLKDTTMQVLKATYAIRQMADQLQLSLTDEEQTQINKDVKNQIALLGGTTNYHDALHQKHLTDHMYREIWEINLCRQKLWSHYFDEGGQFYNDDDAISSDEKQTSYSTLFDQILVEAGADLNIQLQPEYDLISIDTLQ